MLTNNHQTSVDEKPEVSSEVEAPGGRTGPERRADRARRKARKKSRGPVLPRWLREVAQGKAPHSFLVFVLAILMVLVTHRLREDSPTEDEWAHLVRGISFFQNRDMRVHVQHPPLANALAALPSAFDQNPETSEMSTWKDGYSPGFDYIKQDYPKARQQLIKGRYPMMLFLMGLAVYLFYFCLSFFGWPTAAAVLLLVAFNPTLIGQARYIGTDMPAACMTAIAVGELVRYLVRPGLWSILSMGVGISGAVLSKHSGVLLIPMFVLIANGVAAIGLGRFQSEPSRLKRVGQCLLHFAMAGAIVLFSINALYKFDRTGLTVRETLNTPEPKHWVTSRYKDRMLEEHSPLPYLPEDLRIPLPYPYLAGVIAVQEQNRGGYPTYFMGEASRHGHWAYFPVLLLVKNPTGLLLLLGVGAVLLARTRKVGLASAAFLATASLFLVMIMRSNLNMGIRHAAPIIPLLSVLAGRAFVRASELLSGDRLLFVRALGLSGILSAVVVTPHYLNYYNILALGQGSWINVVGDDWGQDRYAFAKFVKQHELKPLYYHTQTPTRKLEADYLGIKYREFDCRRVPKAGSWVAVHVQYVRRFEKSNCASWMHKIEPTHKVNDNVWIYRVPPDGAR